MLIGSSNGPSFSAILLSYSAYPSSPAPRAQPAYEPFNYPANSTIAGKNLGTGWAGPWTGSSNVRDHRAHLSRLVPTPVAKPSPDNQGPADFRSLATPIVGTAGTLLGAERPDPLRHQRR